MSRALSAAIKILFWFSAVVCGVTLAVLTSGCSMEAARQRRVASQGDARAAEAPRNLSKCQFFDGVHVYGDWVAGTSAGLGTAAAALSKSTSGSTSDYATGFAVGFGAVAAAAVAVATQSEVSWTEQCGR